MLVLTKKSCSSNKLCVFKTQQLLSTLKSIEWWVLNNFTQKVFKLHRKSFQSPEAPRAKAEPALPAGSRASRGKLLAGFPSPQTCPHTRCVLWHIPPLQGQALAAAVWALCALQELRAQPGHPWLGAVLSHGGFTGTLWLLWHCLRSSALISAEQGLGRLRRPQPNTPRAWGTPAASDNSRFLKGLSKNPSHYLIKFPKST